MPDERAALSCRKRPKSAAASVVVRLYRSGGSHAGQRRIGRSFPVFRLGDRMPGRGGLVGPGWVGPCRAAGSLSSGWRGAGVCPRNGGAADARKTRATVTTNRPFVLLIPMQSVVVVEV